MRQFLDLDRRFAIAHRGGAICRPENTLAAFDHAVSVGVDAIELDIRPSRDGQPVVIHDPTLDRTTNVTGAVSDRTADELARVDAAFRFGANDGFPFRGQAIGVPRLIDVLTRYPDLPFMIELKDDDPAFVSAAMAVVRRTSAVDRALFGSFSLAALAAVRRTGDFLTSAAVPEATTALIRSKFWIAPPRARGYQLFQVPEVTSTARTRVVSPRFVRLARRAGLPVQVWIVNDADDMRRLAGWGVTGFISDRPDVAVAVRSERPHLSGT